MIEDEGEKQDLIERQLALNESLEKQTPNHNQSFTELDMPRV